MLLTNTPSSPFINEITCWSELPLRSHISLYFSRSRFVLWNSFSTSFSLLRDEFSAIRLALLVCYRTVRIKEQTRCWLISRRARHSALSFSLSAASRLRSAFTLSNASFTCLHCSSWSALIRDSSSMYRWSAVLFCRSSCSWLGSGSSLAVFAPVLPRTPV